VLWNKHFQNRYLIRCRVWVYLPTVHVGNEKSIMSFPSSLERGDGTYVLITLQHETCCIQAASAPTLLTAVLTPPGRVLQRKFSFIFIQIKILQFLLHYIYLKDTKIKVRNMMHNPKVTKVERNHYFHQRQH